MSNASREAPDCTATEGGASSSREAEERLRSEKERASCAHCSMLWMWTTVVKKGVFGACKTRVLLGCPDHRDSLRNVAAVGEQNHDGVCFRREECKLVLDP